MTSPAKPSDDQHHRSYFLPELSRIEAGEFTLTMTGDRSCPINPLATNEVYAKCKLLLKLYRLISVEHLASWRMFLLELTVSPKRFKSTQIFLNNFVTFLPGITRKFQALIEE
jgi:hypothetical protein